MNLRQLIFSNTLSKNCWSKHLGQLFIATSLSAAFPLWHPKISHKKNIPESTLLEGCEVSSPQKGKSSLVEKDRQKKFPGLKKKHRKLFQPSDVFFVQWRLCDTTSRGFLTFSGRWFIWLATEHLLWSIGRRPPWKPVIRPIPEFRFVGSSMGLQVTRTSNRNQTSLTTRT